MQALLAVIATWIAVNFGMPEPPVLPTVAFAAPAEMAAIRYARLAAAGPGDVADHGGGLADSEGEGVFAIYDDEAQTIYLHQDWNGSSPADISLIVHEMVHHMQNLAGSTFACAGEREKDAYGTQRAWLELFDQTLEREFQLDAMTVMLRTTCAY